MEHQILHSMSAMELAECMRRGKFSPIEVVGSHIQRTKKVNVQLNAMVDERFELAMDEARRAEDDIKSGRGRLLSGVPFSAKEFIGVEGMSQTGGFAWKKGSRAKCDATVVARLRQAGAIVIGVSNGPEGGMWMETNNKIYGRTNHPLDLRRTPGGSSGGEAALIASGASAFGVGSDIGGSIRIPAGMCGIAGHKPTGRIVPNTGHFPAAAGEVNACLTCGPMARYASDLLPLLEIMAGPDGKDTMTGEVCLSPQEVSLSKLRVFTLEKAGMAYVWPHMRMAVRSAASLLEGKGACVKPLNDKRLKKSFALWGAMLQSAGKDAFENMMTKSGEISVTKELLRLACRKSGHTIPGLTCVLLQRGMSLLPNHVREMQELCREIRGDLSELLGDDGVILHPSYTRAAPRHYMPMATPADASCTCLFNALEMPATVVPVMYLKNGLPCSVQVIGRGGMDTLTIAVAEKLELLSSRRAE